jgi:hypothetical protein
MLLSTAKIGFPASERKIAAMMSVARKRVVVNDGRCILKPL